MRRALLGALAVLAAAPALASASGVTTHAFMADRARDGVSTPALKSLLDRHRDALISGAAYPDGGYASSSFPGGDYGEITHWERFTNAYAAVLRSRAACRPLASPTGPCANQVAHLMGIAAHGVGDEMWDWMFEPQAADHGESPAHPYFALGLPGSAELASVPPGSLMNTMEYAMDLIAIRDHGRLQELPSYAPPLTELLAAYKSIGRTDVTAQGILAGHSLITAAMDGERLGAVADYDRVKARMPFTSAHMYDESGGVLDVAQAAAGYYEALWAKLTSPSGHAAPRVVSVHPEPGERGVPYDFSAREMAPGPSRGSAQTRIIAVLSNALPFPDGALPADGFRLVDDVTGEVVPLLDGLPRTGPYGNGDGTHSMLIHPARDLEPCHWYRAVVTPAIRDHAGAALSAPYVWHFQTRGAPGGDLPDGCLPGPAAAPFAGAANPTTPGPVVTDLTAAVGDGHDHHADLATTRTRRS